MVYAHEPRTLFQDLAHWAAERPAEPWLVERWTTYEQAISWQGMQI